MRTITSLLLLIVFNIGTVEAKPKVMYGYLKGTIAGVAIDEKIACHGQKEIPEGFIQEYPPLMGKAPPGRMKIGGSTDGKRLTLIVNGKGIDQKLIVRGVKHENGKYIYTGTKKYKSKPAVDVDIKFWCSPEVDHSQLVNKKTLKTKDKKIPYAVREFESIGHGVIDTGSVSYKFDVADCSLNPVKQDNGWIKEYEILGAGVSNGKDFLVKISQSKKGRKGLNDSVIKFAPLPVDTTSADMKAFVYIMNADAIKLMAGNKNSGRRLLVKGNTVVSESKVRLLYMGKGFTSSKRKHPKQATVDIECNN